MSQQQALKVQTESELETESIGQSIGRRAETPLVVMLVGPLGAGKTVFARGVARGLGYDGYVRSPTYTMLHHYPGQVAMFHFDLYRLDDPSELDELGAREHFYEEGVSVVEWADRARDYWPPSYLLVEIGRSAAAADRRILRLTAEGELPTRVLQGVAEELTAAGWGGELSRDTRN